MTNTTMTTSGKSENGRYEPGYKAVLVREETKDQLRELRTSLPDRDLCQERRLATAAIEMMLEMARDCASTRDQLLERTRAIVVRDLNNHSQQQA